MTTLPGVPEQIGRYEIISELGRGAMGHVYLAMDPNIQRKVALKVLLPLVKVDAREEMELQQRFIFEARAAGKLRHPGIVLVYDADRDPDTGLPFIAMEWVDGPSLQDLISESGPLPIGSAARIIEQVAVALDTAHREGLVHRDIKPANILLDGGGQAKVTDFGIAKLTSMSITGTGWIPGTPFYMSPEQVRNEGIDGRSDLFSLGVVLYQCLTGRVPFEGNSLASITYMILEIDPRPPSSIVHSIPKQLASVIQRAMAKSPADRFQSGLEFAQALRQADPATTSEIELARAVPAPMSPDLLYWPNGASSTEKQRTGTMILSDPAVETAEPLDGAVEQDGSGTLAAGVSNPRRRPWSGLSKQTRNSLAVTLSLLFVLFVVLNLRARQSVPPALSRSSPVERSERFVPSQVAGESSISPEFEVLPGWDDRSLTASDPPGTKVLPASSTDAESIFDSDDPSVAHTSEPPGAADSQAVSPTVSLPSAKQSSPPEPTKTAAPARPRVQPRPPKVTTTVQPKTAQQALPPATARLEVLFRNRLKSAELSVWIDERKVWSQSMDGPKNLLRRALGKDVWTTLALREGKHVIDIRITGSEGKLDLVKRTEAKFARGEIKRLRVVLVPRKKLKLEWKDRAQG